MATRATAADSARDWILRTPPALPSLRALLTPVAANAFSQLSVGLSFWNARDFWHPISETPSIISFEIEHGVETKRWAYNENCFAEVRRTGRPVRGEHMGFFDLFVPLREAGRFRGAFVAGPLARARPTSAELLDRWYRLTGSRSNLGDRAFYDYVAGSLATLTLEGHLWRTFERMLECFALMVGDGDDPDALVAEIDDLRRKLLEARFEDRMWTAVRSMLSDRTSHTWAAADQARPLWELGLSRAPRQALVGLFATGPNDDDALDAFLKRHALQRACAHLARRFGGAVSGPVGSQGVVFLTDDAGSEVRARGRLTELATRASALARRYGFRIHAGLGLAKRGDSLAARYLAAFGAAEMALSVGVTISQDEPRHQPSVRQLRQLRQALLKGIEGRRALSSRFEHYIRAVLDHCGYRLEPVRAQLEAGIERLSESLTATGALDEKGFDELWSAMERSAAEETTVSALVERYRLLVADVERAVESPSASRHDRSIERALAFMRDHFSEPIDLTRVARAGGFAPDYFSRLFKARESMTFERYLRRLRLQKAKQMLVGTSLNVDAVSRLCGFRNRVYFHRTFRNDFGITPAEHRARSVFRGTAASAKKH
jgi:AraC-like DNA-binding protein